MHAISRPASLAPRPGSSRVPTHRTYRVSHRLHLASRAAPPGSRVAPDSPSACLHLTIHDLFIFLSCLAIGCGSHLLVHRRDGVRRSGRVSVHNGEQSAFRRLQHSGDARSNCGTLRGARGCVCVWWCVCVCARACVCVRACACESLPLPAASSQCLCAAARWRANPNRR